MINDLIGALAILALASTATTMILKERIVSDNYLHEIEREEARDAAMFTVGSCYRHGWRADGMGGLVCIECGETVDGSEA